MRYLGRRVTTTTETCVVEADNITQARANIQGEDHWDEMDRDEELTFQPLSYSAVAQMEVYELKEAPAQGLSVERWEEKFRPVINHIDPNASWSGSSEDGNEGGIMYETYGAEVEFIYEQDPTKVWTYVDGTGGTYIVNGRQFVNRIGYFLTEVPWDREYEIKVSSDNPEDAHIGDFSHPNDLVHEND